MKRTWTTHDRYNKTKSQRSAISRAISRMEWVGRTAQLSMSSGLAIRSLIREFDIPKVSAVSDNTIYGGYSLLGVEGNYSNGRARVYALDTGTQLIPLASDFWEK